MREKVWILYGLAGGLLGTMLYQLFFDLRFLHAARVANDIRVATGH